MPAKRFGWNLFWGVSNTTITNGLCAPEHTFKEDGGDGTMVADIDVFVPELTPNADGKDMSARMVYDVALMNPLTNQPEKREVTFTNIIRCKYMGGQNEAVPCIHKGEQVWVLQHEGGEFSYYWLPVGRDEGIRNHEHLRWFAHNLPKIKISEDGTFSIGDGTSYFIDINTNPRSNEKGSGKLFQIHTSDNDGELFAYDVRIFPERGALEICDNADKDDDRIAGVSGGNRIEIDSKNTKITLRNIDNSFIRLDKQNITLSCLDTINITAGKKIRVRGGWYDDYKTNAETPLAALSGIVDLITGVHTETQQFMTENTNVARVENIKKDTLVVDTTKEAVIKAMYSVVTPVTNYASVVNQTGAVTITGAVNIIGTTDIKSSGVALNVTGGITSFICTGYAIINGVRVPV